MAGYKNKKLAKIVASVATAGVISLSAIGVNVYQTKTARPAPEKIEPSHTMTDTAGETILDREEHTLAPEPDIITEPIETESATEKNEQSSTIVTRPTAPEQFETESSLVTDDFIYIPQPDVEATMGAATTSPETETSVESTTAIEETTTEETTTNIESPSTENNTEEVTNLLATLTNWFQNHLQEKYNSSSAPNITVTALNGINADINNGIIQIQGEINTNSKTHNYTANISNNDTSLEIYHMLSGSISVNDLISALEEIKTSNQTKMSLSLTQFINIDNQSTVIKSILHSRYSDVSKINSANAKAEAEYLKTILKNVSKCALRVSSPVGVEYDNGYRYTFNAYVNVGKYTYYSTDYFYSDKQLTPEDLAEAVNNQLESEAQNSTTYIIANSAINNLIHQIQQAANELDNKNALSK